MIRIAEESDSKELLEIYAYYVEKTAITFEYEAPSIEAFGERIHKTLKKFPYLISEKDGRLAGYAYAGPFKDRRAYDWSVETTIYIAKDVRGHGLGKELYTALEHALALQNVINLNACIAYPDPEDEYLTRNSVHFHEHMGYHPAGRFHKCGYKFDRWYDMVWMEKCISPQPENPPGIRSFEEIREALADNLMMRFRRGENSDGL